MGSLGFTGFIKAFCFPSVENARKKVAQATVDFLLLCGFPSVVFEIAQLLALFLSHLLHCVNSETTFRKEKIDHEYSFEGLLGEKRLTVCASMLHQHVKGTCVFFLLSNNNTCPILQLLACKHICYCKVLQ